MNLNFTKMHGLGNDFVVLNGLENKIEISANQAQLIADRRLGIGCDQLLLIQPSLDTSVDVRMLIFNKDGSEARQCGNGTRCVADYLYRSGVLKNNEIIIETLGGIISIFRDSDEAIRVDMGIPHFGPKEIPILVKERSLKYTIDLEKGPIEVIVLSMGNPHAVVLVDDIESASTEETGLEIQRHKLFPESVNVSFLQIVDRQHVRLRVYERGAGETLACGTGACAAVVAGILDNKLDNEVVVCFKMGNIVIRWDGNDSHVWMIGPAETVYEGQMTL